MMRRSAPHSSALYAVAAATLLGAGCNPTITAPPLANCPPVVDAIVDAGPGQLNIEGLGLVDEYGARGVSVWFDGTQATVHDTWSTGCSGCEACMVDALASCQECQRVCDGLDPYTTVAAGMELIFEASYCEMGIGVEIPANLTSGHGPVPVTIYTSRGGTAEATWSPPVPVASVPAP